MFKRLSLLMIIGLVGFSEGFAQNKNPVAFVKQTQQAIETVQETQMGIRFLITVPPYVVINPVVAEEILLQHPPKLISPALPKVHVYPALEKAIFMAKNRVDRTKFPDKNRIDAVIFDMDGTLLDSLPAWDHAAARYLKTRGIELPASVEEHIKHLSLLEGARYIVAQLNLPDRPEDLLEHTLAVVRQQYLTEILPKPGAVEILKKLHEQGIKICVATASDAALAQAAFERLDLMQYIDFIIACDEVGEGKHSPIIYEAALYRLGTSKKRTLVVEDALYAVQTAKRAGFLTAGVYEPFHPADYENRVKSTADYFFESLN